MEAAWSGENPCWLVSMKLKTWKPTNKLIYRWFWWVFTMFFLVSTFFFVVSFVSMLGFLGVFDQRGTFLGMWMNTNQQKIIATPPSLSSHDGEPQQLLMDSSDRFVGEATTELLHSSCSFCRLTLKNPFKVLWHWAKHATTRWNLSAFRDSSPTLLRNLFRGESWASCSRPFRPNQAALLDVTLLMDIGKPIAWTSKQQGLKA